MPVTVIFLAVLECVHMHNHSESQYDRLLSRFLRLLQMLDIPQV